MAPLCGNTDGQGSKFNCVSNADSATDVYNAAAWDPPVATLMVRVLGLSAPAMRIASQMCSRPRHLQRPVWMQQHAAWNPLAATQMGQERGLIALSTRAARPTCIMQLPRLKPW